MHVDGEQRSEAGPSDRQQDISDMQASDLHVQQGVGRCYYTHLPRLVKVILGARNVYHALHRILTVPACNQFPVSSILTAYSMLSYTLHCKDAS